MMSVLRPATAAISEMAAVHAASIRAVSYNIYFGDEGMKERTSGIIDCIRALKPLPDVIGFQEVTMYSEEQLAAFAREVGYQYITASATMRASYYCSMMVSPRFSVTRVISEKFRNTGMDRHLFGFDGTLTSGGQRVLVLTSHLESLRPFSKKRLDQLGVATKLISDAEPGALAIFMGDMNLEDGEVEKSEGVLPSNIGDAWVDLGSDDTTKYTWDMQKNDIFVCDKPEPQRRFDRVFYNRATGWAPTAFSIMGTQRLPCGLFPSDHWGICCDFELKQAAVVPPSSSSCCLSP